MSNDKNRKYSFYQDLGFNEFGIEMFSYENLIRTDIQRGKYIDWDFVSKNTNQLSKEFLVEFKDRLNWDIVLKTNKNLSEEVLDYCSDRFSPFCWKIIFQYYSLSENFIEKHFKIYHSLISKFQKLSESFIKKNIHKFNFDVLLEFQDISEDFIEELLYNFDSIHWSKICGNQRLSKEFILKYRDKIKIEDLQNNKKIDKDIIIDSINTIDKFQLEEKKIIENLNRSDLSENNWLYISRSNYISERFMYNYAKYIDWQYLSQKYLSINLIDYCSGYFSSAVWDNICLYQKLPESFIQKYSNKVNWKIISAHQKLSLDFIKKYTKKLDYFELINNEFLEEDVKSSLRIYSVENNFLEKINNDPNDIDWDDDYIYSDILTESGLLYLINNNIDFNWSIASTYVNLSEEFIENFENKVNWKNISRFQRLSKKFIEKYKDKCFLDLLKINTNIGLKNSELGELFDMNWNNIGAYRNATEEVIEKNLDKIYWSHVSNYTKLSEEFIEKYQDKVHWDFISNAQVLSEEFIEKYKDKVNWSNISEQQFLSASFIRKYRCNFNSYKLSLNYKLASDVRSNLNFLLKGYSDYEIELAKIDNLKDLLYSSGLSERFIEDFADKLDWTEVSVNQILSLDFIKKHADKLNYFFLKRNPNISNEIKDELDYIFEEDIKEGKIYNKSDEQIIIKQIEIGEKNWTDISLFDDLSEYFIKNYKYNLNFKHLKENEYLSKNVKDKLDEIYNSCTSEGLQLWIDKYLSEGKDIDWDYISGQSYLTEEFIKNNEDNINWYYFITSTQRPENIIEKYADKLNWDLVFRDQNLSDKFKEKHKHRLNEKNIDIETKSKDVSLTSLKNRVNLDKDFFVPTTFKPEYLELPNEEESRLLKRTTNEFNGWKNISLGENLSEEFIEKYQDFLYYGCLIKNKNISKELKNKIDEIFDKRQSTITYWVEISPNMDWEILSSKEKLSEKFIEKYKDKLWSFEISYYQKLSEEFIEKHQDILYWKEISRGQFLSEEFIEKHQDKIYWDCILENPNISNKIKESFILAREMNDKGFIHKDNIINQFKDIMTWNNEGFESVKRMVDKQPRCVRTRKFESIKRMDNKEPWQKAIDLHSSIPLSALSLPKKKDKNYQKAIYRTSSKQITKRIINNICRSIENSTKNSHMANEVAKLLNSEIGRNTISLVIGIILENKNFNNDVIKKIANEMQIEALSDSMEGIVEQFLEYATPMISGILEEENISNQNIRVEKIEEEYFDAEEEAEEMDNFRA